MFMLSCIMSCGVSLICNSPNLWEGGAQIAIGNNLRMQFVVLALHFAGCCCDDFPVVYRATCAETVKVDNVTEGKNRFETKMQRCFISTSCYHQFYKQDCSCPTILIFHPPFSAATPATKKRCPPPPPPPPLTKVCAEMLGIPGLSSPPPLPRPTTTTCSVI